MANFDLAVAYRIYPKVAKPALGLPFSDDKLKLSEICLRSFKKSLGNLRVKLWALLDGCADEYANLFRKYFGDEDLVLLPLAGLGNQATFGRQIDILLSQKDCDMLYFAEDDYFYLPNQFAMMIEFLQSQADVDFVTPYDHLDCYRLAIHRDPKWIRVAVGHHWRTAASTCLTFLTRKETLRKTEKVFRSYCRLNHDCSLWLSLTKKSLFNPVQFLRFVLKEPHLAKVLAKSWFYGWKQILWGQHMNLWTPVPGIATHLDVKAMSPTIDWPALIELEAATIGFGASPAAGQVLVEKLTS